MPKVLLVAHWDWVHYNFRLPLARTLREKGYDVIFVCPSGDYVAKLRGAGFHVLNWHVRRRSLNPFREGWAIIHLAYLYWKEGPDIVNHFTIKPNLYGSIAALISGVPKVLNAFTGLGFVFSGALRARLIRAGVLPLLRRVLHRGRSLTIFQTATDRALFLDLGLVAPERSSVIAGSGVSTELFMPHTFGNRLSKEPVVLLAARLLLDKGVHEFVKAAETLQLSGIKAQFWIAGEPDRGNPASVSDEMVEIWRRQGFVQCLGHRDNMPDLLRQADIAVLPTSYQEGVPRFLLEAAATGLPLVATDIEGCRMVVRDGINGFLVSPQDVKALAQAIAKLLLDPALRARMGHASREIAVTEFDERHIIGQYLELYRGLSIVSGGEG